MPWKWRPSRSLVVALLLPQASSFSSRSRVNLFRRSPKTTTPTPLLRRSRPTAPDLPTSPPSSSSSVIVRRMSGTETQTSSAAAATSRTGRRTVPSFSNKVVRTLDPCVVLMKQMVGEYEQRWSDQGGIYSLAQGVVYWTPPEPSLRALREALQVDSGSELHMYGPDEGLPELRAALERKLRIENGLSHHDVMITVGANQAYANCVLTLLSGESQHRAVVFAPYYFNHVMALQLTLPPEGLLVGPCDGRGRPDLDWLEAQLENASAAATDSSKIHMVTIVNPGNPTGVTLSRSYLQRAVNLCRQHDCWLVLDCTYEYFVHGIERDDDGGGDDDDNDEQDGQAAVLDACFDDEPHVIHIFSFSKSYALAGYRVGYLALPRDAVGLYEQMLKVQDTVPIAPSRISQVAALGALEAGRPWVSERFATLRAGREAILGALAPLDGRRMGGGGAMYVMAQLPPGHPDDRAVARRLVRDFGVAVIPGSFCGFPGWIRVCYSNLPPDRCLQGACEAGVIGKHPLRIDDHFVFSLTFTFHGRC